MLPMLMLLLLLRCYVYPYRAHACKLLKTLVAYAKV
jgi:hypothetical protein